MPGTGDHGGQDETLRRPRSLTIVTLAILAAVTVGALAACGDSPPDFSGYYRLPGETWVMHIEGQGGTYTATGIEEGVVRAVISEADPSVLIAEASDGEVSYRLSLSPDRERLTWELRSGAGGTGETWAAMELGRIHKSDAEVEAELAALSKSRETDVREGIDAIQAGLQTWAQDHGDRFPRATEVKQFGDVGMEYVDPWPKNPYDDKAMRQGDGPGDYTYERLERGSGFKLTGHFEGGSFTVP